MVDQGATTTPPSANAAASETSLGVAEGYRPVGALGLVFEVPDAWGTNEVACDGSPTADTVAFGLGRDCLIVDPPTVSSLIITTDGNRLVADALANLSMSPTRINGVEFAVSEPTQLGELWAFAVADGEGRVALVRAEDESVARHVHRGLRAIPDGYVTIPLVPRLSSEEVSAKLTEFGLVPTVTDVPASELPPGSVVGTDPPVASVVPVGGEVRVLQAK